MVVFQHYEIWYVQMKNHTQLSISSSAIQIHDWYSILVKSAMKFIHVPSNVDETVRESAHPNQYMIREHDKQQWDRLFLQGFQ